MATITIQPSGATGIDTYVNEFAYDYADGASVNIYFGSRSGNRRHTLIKFDLASLAGETIIAATLYLTSASTNACTIKVHRILDANSGWTEGATWNYADGSSVRWAGDAATNGGTDAGCSISGTDYAAAEMGSFDISDTLYGATSGALDLTEFAAMVADNYGLFIRTTYTGTVNRLAFSSDYTTTPSYRPKLVVETAPIPLAATGASTSAGSLALGASVGYTLPGNAEATGGANSYNLWLSRDDGTRLALLDMVIDYQYVIALHAVGACVLRLPGTFDKALLAVDRRLEFWRRAGGGRALLERVYLIRAIVDATDANGMRTLTVTGVDGNDLLRRRIVAYNAGSAQAEMTDQSDDMLRAIVVDNLGADAVAARQIASTYLTIAAENSDGVSMSAGFSRRNVLTVLQDIAATANAAGTPVYWHMVDVDSNTWEFRTYTDQPGLDHTFPAGPNPVFLGLEYGNLSEPTLTDDYASEVTYAYAGGQGEGVDRVLKTAEDVARSGRSIFGRCEGWADARGDALEAGVLAAAQRLLAEGEPKHTFTARIVESSGTRYGLHWRWGDRVTASYAGETYDAMITAVTVTVDSNGKETISANLAVQL